ncbi:hypothetical protein EV363DRAFT_6581 [Boletus edulis]|nr:hypothetical protein EV363DRAFT_6581 [Boletus edulis]
MRRRTTQMVQGGRRLPPIIIGAVKPKRGPSVQQGPKRVTRSVSMKEQRVKVGRAEIEDTTPEVPVTSTNTVAGPSSAVESKPRLLKSTGVVTAKSKPPLIAQRPASVSKLPSDSSKLKQTSLATFVKAKPSATGITTTGNSAASTSTGTGGPSRVASSSPSKIPLFASPLKRASTSQPGNTKPFVFSLGSTGTGGTGTSRGNSGRSLATLSHALDKLAAPPPSRPNTSMGFSRGEGTSEEDSSPKNDNKGKGKAEDDASLPMAFTPQGTRTSFARPTASSLKRAATVTGFGSAAAAAARMRGGAVVGGSGRGRGVRGIFGKAGDRASKKTSLPVVMGSPVKGSRSTSDLDLGADKHTPRLGSGSARGAGGFTGEDVFMSQDTAADDSPEQDSVMQDVLASPSMAGGEDVGAQKPPPPDASNGVEIDLTTSPISADKGKQRAVSSSTLNPASSALHALSESLSSLPHMPTPPNPRAIGTRTGLRSSSAAVGKESPALGGTGVGPSGNSEVHGSSGAGPNGGTVDGSGGVKTSTLKILKRCAIFVDVRTEQGDDAGSLFTDMLKGLGAKIMSRLGSRCTHIVYKNGHPHTLTRYRLLNDPKPVVIGIAWVVECVEKRARVDEERFKIDVDLINVAGVHLKRRSMLPKHLIPVSPSPDYEIPIHVSSEADEDDEGLGGIDGSLSQDPDLSMRSKEEDDLPPLERARRRRSILPGGQTRLFL